ncbi:MAG: MBL fold metallo-hydrolase [Hyphomicrobiales bacterium]|nr:MBL fold metallo-hydrolase [Hyphomicrobiales bacterium]
MSFTFTILGCGSSGGVPRVGSGWGHCDPANPRNRRRRCSMLVDWFGAGNSEPTRVLIDTSPDLREQLLDADVARLDAILMTHPHADHTNGIDDVRPLVIHNRRRIDIHMDQSTSDVLRRAFGYIFQTPQGSLYPPLLNEKRLVALQPCDITGPGGALQATPFLLNHGEIDALGFRFGDVAYTPDVKFIHEASKPMLEGLDLWIIDALRFAPHPSHFSLDDALAHIAQFRPRRAVLTNLHNDLDYAQLAASLPPGITPAYDGMIIKA